MKYKNILCPYPYRQELKTVGFLPPIGLEYIASAIENLVDTIKVIDLRFEKKPLPSIIDESIDLVFISYNWDVEGEFVKDVINSIPEKRCKDPRPNEAALLMLPIGDRPVLAKRSSYHLTQNKERRQLLNGSQHYCG